jgi:succinate dehydrogenase/fumarate reductase flavoprotein subunit
MSDMPGLFAAGMSQAIDPGLFNGWSSMRAMWSGERSGAAAAKFLKDASDINPDADEVYQFQRQALEPLQRNSGTSPDAVCRRIKQILFPYTVCLRKEENRLKEALAEIQHIRENEVPALYAEDPHELVKAHETANMALVAELFLRASLERKETRGDHYREDFPKTDNKNWLKWINIIKDMQGKPHLETETVPLASYRYQPEN